MPTIAKKYRQNMRASSPLRPDRATYMMYTMSNDHAQDAQRAELEAATALWEEIAAYAWDQFVTFGQGVVLVEQVDLLAAHQVMGTEHPLPLVLGYVPVTDIPPGDDFRALIRTVHPRKQVALLVRRNEDSDGEDAEQFYVLEMLEGKRPSPEDCYFAKERARTQ